MALHCGDQTPVALMHGLKLPRLHLLELLKVGGWVPALMLLQTLLDSSNAGGKLVSSSRSFSCIAGQAPVGDSSLMASRRVSDVSIDCSARNAWLCQGSHTLYVHQLQQEPGSGLVRTRIQYPVPWTNDYVKMLSKADVSPV